VIYITQESGHSPAHWQILSHCYLV